MVLKMSVTTTEVKEMMETITNSTVKTAINNAIIDVKAFTDASPNYSGAVNLDNVSLAKSTPKNGISTFDFVSDYGITITISYRS
jgi:hypothetical protein